MTYEELTDDQKQILAEFDRFFRPTVGRGAKYLAAARIVLLAWTTGAQEIVESLDDMAVVPNTTGLAGARPLLAAEIKALIGGFGNLVAGYGGDETVALHVKAAGINAVAE